MPEPRRKLDWPASGGSGLRCSLVAPDDPRQLIASIGFQASRPRSSGQGMTIGVNLRPLLDTPAVEYWTGASSTATAWDAGGQASTDSHYRFEMIEVNEREHGGIRGAAEYAYRQVERLQRQSAYPHVLRMWNYFADINAGSDDGERYKQFCVGRAAALTDIAKALPAASAIGTRAADGVLQVYWLAGREPGRPIENPRQTSAYRYPRQYGPASPSFSRAMLTGGTLFISGTASIVGHASKHAGNLRAQLDETLQNIDTLVTHAHQLDRSVPERIGAGSPTKLYVRNADDAPYVLTQLRARYGDSLPLMAVEGDICRQELLLEIECVHGAAAR